MDLCKLNLQPRVNYANTLGFIVQAYTHFQKCDNRYRPSRGLETDGMV